MPEVFSVLLSLSGQAPLKCRAPPDLLHTRQWARRTFVLFVTTERQVLPSSLLTAGLLCFSLSQPWTVCVVCLLRLLGCWTTRSITFWWKCSQEKDISVFLQPACFLSFFPLLSILIVVHSVMLKRQRAHELYRWMERRWKLDSNSNEHWWLFIF